MPNVPQLNIRRDFGTPPASKEENHELRRKPLGYRKYPDKPTVLKMPHPFKCSKCDYVGETKDELRKHWTFEH